MSEGAVFFSSMKGERKGRRRLRLVLAYLAGLGTDVPTEREMEDVQRFCQWLAMMQRDLQSAENKPLTAELQGLLLVQHLMHSGDEEAVLAVLGMEEASAAGLFSLQNCMGHSILDSALALGRRKEAMFIMKRADPSVLLEPGLEVDCAVARCAYEGDRQLLEVALAGLLLGKDRYKALELALAEATRGGWQDIVEMLIGKLEAGEMTCAVVAALRAAATGGLQTAKVLQTLLPLVDSGHLLAKQLGVSQCILMRAARQACPEVCEQFVGKLLDEQDTPVGEQGSTSVELLLDVEWPVEDLSTVVIPILDQMRPESLVKPRGSTKETPLIVAVKSRQLKLARALAERLRPEDLAMQDSRGRTGLIHAVMADDVAMASMLTSLMSTGKALRDESDNSARDYCKSAEMLKLPLAPAVKGAGM